MMKNDGAYNSEEGKSSCRTSLSTWDRRHYSHSYRGMGARIFFETGYFGSMLFQKDLTSMAFKVFDDGDNANANNDGANNEDSKDEDKEGEDDDEHIEKDTNNEYGDREEPFAISYTDVLNEENSSHRAMQELPKQDLVIEIIQLIEDETVGASSITYRLVSASKPPFLWESGKICQHYEYRALEFDKPGLVADNKFNFTLWILVWPDSITLVLDLIKKGSNNAGSYGILEGGFKVKMKFKDWTSEQHFHPKINPLTKNTLTTILTCNIGDHHCADTEQKEKPNSKIFRGKSGIDIDVSTTPIQPFRTGYTDRFNSFLLKKKGGELYRTFRGGYTDIREYDSFNVAIRNELNEDFYVPTLLFVQKLANPTGVCPQICDGDGAPTGIPIQLSKNWHNKNIRNYGRFYCLLPAKANSVTTYCIRIIYGFYGSLPAASHANLSLVGYDVHGSRWEQLAIGCWGESYCMDVDMRLCSNVITDMRMLMTKGSDEKKWMWSDAGWGGDWLRLRKIGTNQPRYRPYMWKFAYNSHGPCLTDVDYSGYYGKEVVSMQANVKTTRSDDFARTFTHLRYTFNESIPFQTASFFELGTAGNIATPHVVWGNREKSTGGVNVPQGLGKSQRRFVDCQNFEGKGPWWFGFPKQMQIDNRSWGKGCRGLVIRSYSGFFGGKSFSNPTFALVNAQRGDSRPNLKFILNPPPGVNSFDKGDWVDFHVEVVTFPRSANDYYGPNNSFREHLLQFGDTWKPFHREAQGNDLSIDITVGGKLESNYPIIIMYDGVSNDIEFTIYGGVGAVPIRFNGMHTCKSDLSRIDKDGTPMFNIRKFQEKHGSDFYQVEFDPKTQLYNHTFNIMLDAYTASSSKWSLHCYHDE